MTMLNILLRLYPREWRERYEDEFAALLELNPLSLVDLGDIALGALDAHLRPQVAVAQVQNERRPFVNRASFIRWSGMAGMVGSVLALLGLVAIQIFSDNEYPYTYDGLDITASLFFLTGVVLTLVFAVGFALTYARRLGGLGQVGLLVTLVSLLSVGVGATGRVGEAIRGSEMDGWWNFFMLGMLGTLAGASVFCLAGSIQKVLPALGCRTTMIGGLGALALLFVSMGIIPGTGYETLKVGLGIGFLVSFIIFKAGLFLLAYALWTEREVVSRRVEAATMG